MEFNHQTAEKSEQIRWSTDDQAGVGQVRSYTCAFCKRGFSNAQALGGHMNIHRRDRAKLKQSSEENLLSLDISVKNTTDHEPQPPLEEKILFKLDSGDEMRATSVMVERIDEKRIMELNHASSKDELDLELRLGPEPQEAPTLSTREFF